MGKIKENDKMEMIKRNVIAKLIGKQQILVDKLKKAYNLLDNDNAIKTFKEFHNNKDLEENRYIVFEDYNIDTGFFWRDYGSHYEEVFDEFVAEELQDDYYSDCENVSDCAIIDLKTLEIYHIERRFKFKITKVR